MSNRSLNDQDLIDLYVNGNEGALEILVTRHKRKIFSYILKNVRDRALAEDIFQDTFIKVITTIKKGSYNDEGKFLPWVMRIAHNLVIDHFRREKRMPKVNAGNRSEEEFDIFKVLKIKESNIEDRMMRQQLRTDIRKLVSELPAEQREVVVMRLYLDMSFQEISDETKVSINTALGRMRYALINLRKMMEKKQMVLG